MEMRKIKGNTLRSLITLLLLVIFLLPSGSVYAKSPTTRIDNNTVGMTRQEKKVYKKMKALKKKLPEGKKWTNSKLYNWKGGIFTGGYGCAGFAFKLSDEAFGDAPARTHRKWKKIRVGDIIRLNYDSHSVIVMKVVGKKYVVAEGNYNRSVHWGRIIERSYIKKTGTYVMTRW